MKLSLIAAIGQQNELGKDNKMAWNYPEDLQFFKEKTKGELLIMGRNTWHSIGAKPLPKRMHIILSKKYCPLMKQALGNVEDVAVFDCWDMAFHFAKIAYFDEPFIIGGAQIYAQALQMPELQTCYITRIPETVQDADTFFPIELLEQNFILSQSREQVASNGKTLVFETWEIK